MQETNGWSKDKRIQYELFLLLHIQEFTKEDRNPKREKLFLKLSKWMENKSPDKCRIHHKNRLKQVNNIHQLIDNIIRFNYEEREIPISHFQIEIEHFINQVFESGRIQKEQRDESLHKAEFVLELLRQKKQVQLTKNDYDEVLDLQDPTHQH